MDMIWLVGVECRARLGVPKWERKKRQKVLLDIGLELPLAKAGRSDNVRDTADYWAIEKEARKIAESGEYHLAESLAWKVAEAVLKINRRLRSVRVAVHKRPSVMPKTREVVVSITVRRK
jgi:FolB domain-containing protein